MSFDLGEKPSALIWMIDSDCRRRGVRLGEPPGKRPDTSSIHVAHSLRAYWWANGSICSYMFSTLC